MICLNFNIPQVQKDYDELVKIFDSKNIAYAVLSQNNGYGLEYDYNGNQSSLFDSLMKLDSINGDRVKAIQVKSTIYSKSFQSWYGKDITKVEPRLRENYFVNNTGELRPIVVPSNNLFSDTSVLARFNKKVEPIIIKEGINFVFEQSKELSDIGSKQQYSKYLDTIFPDSKIKDIVYHGGRSNITKFDLKFAGESYGQKYGAGIYTTTNLKLAKDYYDIKENLTGLNEKEVEEAHSLHKKIYPLLINTKDIVEVSEATEDLKNKKDIYTTLKRSIYDENLISKIYAAQDVLSFDEEEGVDIFGTKEKFNEAVLQAKKDSKISPLTELWYIVKNVEQIHILGSEQDKEGFKRFIENGSRVTEKTSLQGKALKFLNKSGEGNIGRIFNESSSTMQNPKKVKDINRLTNMLEKASDNFQKNGLFIHEGDPYIMSLNANLFEDIVDESKLVSNMGIRMKIRNRTEGLAEHNVITKKDKDGNRWVVVSDAEYGTKWTDLTAVDRKQQIYERNLDRIKWANERFVNVTGREAITVREFSAKGKNHNIAVVSINEDVLKDYNDVKYNQYLNSMQMYMESGTEEHEDLDMSSLYHKLNEEKSRTKQEKANLEVTGGKQTDINTLENKLETIKDRIDKITKDGELVDIYNEAELNLIDIEKVLDSNKITSSQFIDAQNKLQMWIVAGDFSEEKHIFLDEEMMQSEIIQDKFSEIGRRASLLMPKLLNKGKVLFANGVNTEFGTELPFEQIVSLPHKIGAWFKNTLSLNRVGQALAQYIHKIVNEANNEAHREVKTKSRALGDLFKKVIDIGFDQRLFYQFTDVDIDGTIYKVPTGRLVHKFAQKYFGIKKNNVSFRKNNQITIDPTKLSDPKYIAELERHLGVIGSKEYIDKAKAKYDSYQKIEMDHILLEYGEGELTQEQKADLAIWRKRNSPLERIKAMELAKGGLIADVIGKDTFLAIVPRKFDKKGKDLGYYDTNYNSVEANPVALEFYKEAKEITNTAQTLYGHSDMKSTALAFVESGMLAKLNKVGVSNFFTKELYKEMLESLEGGEAINERIDPITKKPIKSLRLGTQTIDGLIKDSYNNKKLEAQLKLGRELTESERGKLYVDTSNEVFSRTEFSADNSSLFKSLNMLNLAALSFKHSSMIEDTVNMALTYLPNSTVNTGDKIIDTKGNTVGEEYLQNLKEMIDYFLKEAYYKEPKGDTSKNLLTVRTAKDKAREAELVELEKKATTEEEQKYISAEMHKVGTRVTTDSLIRNLMGFMRLKGMGWNIPAGIANLAFGKITNMYKAAEGRLYNFKEWMEAEKSLLTQWGKFNKVTENYNILGDILYEFEESNKFETGQNWFFKTVKSLKPYAIQTVTEKHNQGTVMIAMMLHQKVTNAKGEEKPMWEAINDDGKLDSEWSYDNKSGDKAIASMVAKIKSQIQEIHGDYSNPLMIKSTTAGQAVSMFRLWFFEVLHSRVGAEKQDYIRGFTTKGRYVTWLQLTKKYKLNPRALYRAYKNNELSEVDIANTRVNLAELATMVLTYGLYALLKKGICGDDKSCKDANFFQLSAMNMMLKVNKDIQFFYNPKAWSDFIKNPTAMTGLLDDMWKLYDLSYKTILGDEEGLVYKAGSWKGQDKRWVFLKSQLPFINSIERMKRFGDNLVQTN